jgi:hypothetical protein
MKSNGYRLIRRGSDEAASGSGAASCRSFRIMSQGVPGDGEVKDKRPKPQRKQKSAGNKGLGVLACSHYLETRSQPIYAWPG